eukprot:TRINITY_DN1648_c0_g2_i1.p1 TRINITY_DN1648_c0_g2~~TRINITY_DN1648_c0_g2_i1.p1  ORF type:complete len:559 (+),score=88.93 TRINITY_DN1648_c0_g2_i1:144-1679(+)
MTGNDVVGCGASGGQAACKTTSFCLEQGIEHDYDVLDIYMDPGAYHGLGYCNLTFSNNITNMQSSTGKRDVIIGCENLSRHIAILPSTLYSNISNIIFMEGDMPMDEGGSIQASATVQTTITNCVFRSNNAMRGGAISAAGGSLLIQACFFDSNSALTGGAIFIPTGVADEDEITILWSNFSLNVATLSAGAVWINHRTTIQYCNFHSGYSQFGGALQIFSSSVPILIDNVQVIGNAAGRNGGGIWVSLDQNPESIVIQNSTIYDNSADMGGGLHVVGVVGPDTYGLLLYNVSITNNVAMTTGGGFSFVSHDADLIDEEVPIFKWYMVDIYNNHVDETSTSPNPAGGVYLQDIPQPFNMLYVNVSSNSNDDFACSSLNVANIPFCAPFVCVATTCAFCHGTCFTSDPYNLTCRTNVPSKCQHGRCLYRDPAPPTSPLPPMSCSCPTFWSGDLCSVPYNPPVPGPPPEHVDPATVVLLVVLGIVLFIAAGMIYKYRAVIAAKFGRRNQYTSL